MAEPNVPHGTDDHLSDTLPTTPAGDLFGVRSALTRELLEIRTRLNRVQDSIAFASYGDVSKLGADRARIALAARLVNEVAATVTDLAFPSTCGEETP
jgi:hypothetical protein